MMNSFIQCLANVMEFRDPSRLCMTLTFGRTELEPIPNAHAHIYIE